MNAQNVQNTAQSDAAKAAKTPITCQVDAEVRRGLRIAAAVEDLSLSALVAQILNNWFEDNDPLGGADLTRGTNGDFRND